MSRKEDTVKLLSGPTLIRPPRLRMLRQSGYLVPFYVTVCLAGVLQPVRIILLISCVPFAIGYVYVYLRVLRLWKMGHGSRLSLFLFNVLLLGLMFGATLLLKK